MSSLSADVSVWMVSHIGTWLTVWRFNLQSLDLARVLNSVVFKGRLGSLLMFMLDLLWSGVNLLFSLTLSTIKGALRTIPKHRAFSTLIVSTALSATPRSRLRR